MWAEASEIWYYKLCQCMTCESILRPPLPIEKYHNYFYPQGFIHNKFAEYGHLVSEFNGGGITTINLRPQCKNCNLKFRTKNISKNDMDIDSAMVDSSDLDRIYQINNCKDKENETFIDVIRQCSYMTSKNEQCKNNCHGIENACSTHLNSYYKNK